MSKPLHRVSEKTIQHRDHWQHTMSIWGGGLKRLNQGQGTARSIGEHMAKVPENSYGTFIKHIAVLQVEGGGAQGFRIKTQKANGEESVCLLGELSWYHSPKAGVGLTLEE